MSTQINKLLTTPATSISFSIPDSVCLVTSIDSTSSVMRAFASGLKEIDEWIGNSGRGQTSYTIQIETYRDDIRVASASLTKHLPPVGFVRSLPLDRK